MKIIKDLVIVRTFLFKTSSLLRCFSRIFELKAETIEFSLMKDSH